MNTPPPQTSTQEQVLAAFVRELEMAPDRAAVVAGFAARHPDLVGEFAAGERVGPHLGLLPCQAEPGLPLALGRDAAVGDDTHRISL